MNSPTHTQTLHAIAAALTATCGDRLDLIAESTCLYAFFYLRQPHDDSSTQLALLRDRIESLDPRPNRLRVYGYRADDTTLVWFRQYRLDRPDHRQPVTIRVADPRVHTEAIVAIQLAAIDATAAKHYRPEQVRALRHSKARPRNFGEWLCVAEREGVAIGFASLSALGGTIGAVYVFPDYFRRGIGAQLLERLETEAIRRDRTSLSVSATLYAEPFYAACGYRRVGEIPVAVGSVPLPTVAMVARLFPRRLPAPLRAKRRRRLYWRAAAIALVAIAAYGLLLL